MLTCYICKISDYKKDKIAVIQSAVVGNENAELLLLQIIE